MADLVEFFIDGKPYATPMGKYPVRDILSLAGLSADKFFLISPDGIKYSDAKQEIEIHPGDHFTTEKLDQDHKPETPVKIHYRVNGEQQTTNDATQTVEQILRRAGKAASIDLQQLKSYILENIKTGKKYESLTDMVEILNDDQFLAVHSGATPVAPLLPR